MSYAYLGPPGTFTEAALRRMWPADDVDALACPTVLAACDAVRSGQCEAAVVPLENSENGVVPATIGELARADGALRISAEVEIPVRFALLAVPGAGLGGIRRVDSHPHALDQCRGWLARHLPDAAVGTATSTAAAAADVAACGDPSRAAVAASVNARIHGLDVLADDLGSDAHARTRFVVLRRAADCPPTGSDRTSLLVRTAGTGAGALAGVLAELAGRGLNLDRILSWSTERRLGTYDFAVDVDGHVGDPRLAAALAAIRRGGASVTVLGSYPRAASVTAVGVPA